MNEPAQSSVTAFPAAGRTGRIREVARNLLDMPTDPQSDSYRCQVTRGIEAQLSRVGMAADQQRDEITAFWQAVRDEMGRQVIDRLKGEIDPKGAA